jgi:hypothetical protein
MTRSSRITILAGFLLGAAFLSGYAGGRALAGDGGKCTIATTGDSPTAKACTKGGRAEAKKMMKKMVKDAKEKGQKFTCEGCHKDLDNYELTKNGKDDFKKLEALIGG